MHQQFYDEIVMFKESGTDLFAVGAKDGVHDRAAEGRGLHNITLREDLIHVRDRLYVFQQGDESIQGDGNLASHIDVECFEF